MDQSISRLVALTVYANITLQDRAGDFDLDKLIAENSYAIEFVDPLPKGIAGSPKIIASNPSLWFHFLRDQGILDVKMHGFKSGHPELPDHISAAFVGGGSGWLLEARRSDSSDIYREMYHQGHKKQLVRVQESGGRLQDSSWSVEVARRNLSEVLEATAELASRHKYTTHWADLFHRAKNVLDEHIPSPADSFLPAGMLSTAAHQLLSAVESSWVFGGMGSWNDLSFPGRDQDLYGELTARLYDTICKCIVAGANDSIR